MTTELETMAIWAAELRPEDVPDRVLEIARIQLRSVLASLYPGANSAAGKACRKAALQLGTTGAATVLPTGESVHPYAAVLANAALSMAHDFDDYLFLGHTGHSAVVASLAAAEQADASVQDLLIAQVVANEVAGRLGAYVCIGPQNGQLWAHIHLAGAVVAAARLRGLDAERTADALAIAFYQPPFTLFQGFMASEAKALTAAQPAAMGLYAVGLAADGMRGAREILEHPRGFANQFAFIPAPQMLRGLGRAWVTDTTSCKIYPGCAYIDGPVDAALAARGAQPLRADEIAQIDITATALTAGMEGIAEAAAPASSLDPITINFSARRSVAIALLAGELRPHLLDGPWLADNADAVRTVAARTRVQLSATQTVSMLDGIARAVPLASFARSVGARRAWRARHRLQDAYVSAARSGGARADNEPASGPGLRDALGLIGPLLRRVRATRTPFDMNQVDFTQLEFRFGAEVEIRLRDGRTLRGKQTIPQGAAGSGIASMRELMEQKLRSEAGHETAAAVEELLARPAGEVSARSLARAAVRK